MSTSEKSPFYHHGDLRAALITAALAILEEGGDPAALTLREAARRAGVSAMAPYRHFADKAELLAAVAIVGYGRLETELREADRLPSPSDALIGQGIAYVEFACSNPALFRLMFGATLGERRGPLAGAGAAAFAAMADRVASIVEKGDGADWALRCWATAHGLASLALDGQLAGYGEPTAVLADRILRLGTKPMC